MRKVFVVSFALVLSLVTFAPFKPASARKASRYASAKGEVIVKLKPAAGVINTISAARSQDELMVLARDAGMSAGSLSETQSGGAIEPLISLPANNKTSEIVSRYGFDRTFV